MQKERPSHLSVESTSAQSLEGAPSTPDSLATSIIEKSSKNNRRLHLNHSKSRNMQPLMKAVSGSTLAALPHAESGATTTNNGT